jgi:hypothetical protein
MPMVFRNNFYTGTLILLLDEKSGIFGCDDKADDYFIQLR